MVLAQALVLAVIVLLLPLGAGRRAIRRDPGARHVLPKVFFYFAALGFGFFFIELTLVKKLSFFLESSTLSFAAVLAGVLVFSGHRQLARVTLPGKPQAGTRGRACRHRRQPCLLSLRA